MPNKYYFSIQGNYGQGFEEVTAEELRDQAMQRLKEYRENDPRTPYRCRILQDK